MKKYTILLIFLLSISSNSQNLLSKNFIRNNLNINNIISYIKDNKERLKADSISIEKFLVTNQNFKKKYVEKNTTYEVYKILNNRPIYRSTDNSSASLATRTSRLNTGGITGLNLDGDNMLIGVWDGGKARITHEEFKDPDNLTISRITTPDNFVSISPSNDHSTHVVGTIGSRGFNPTAKGMAPKCNIVSYDWNSDTVEVANEVLNNGLLISNHSYGVPVLNENGNLNVPVWIMGNYNNECVSWDQFAQDSPYYLMITSAGNSGMDSYTGGSVNGYDKLTYEKNAKNNLVIANSNPTVNLSTGELSSIIINPSSSQGPSDDGRIKPDISGDGTNLYSPIGTSDNSYDTYSGTSMASPNVAGSLLLLQEYYNRLHPGTYMRSSTLKALACHSALDAGLTGPDPIFGYGLLDSQVAANILTNSTLSTPTSIVNELTLNQNQIYERYVTLTSPKKLIATICWTDVPGIAQDNNHNSTNKALVNDLDIRIIKDTEEFFPWKLNFPSIFMSSSQQDNDVDNVEKIEIEDAIGTYKIRISHKGNLVGSFQNYSLIVSGIDQTLGTVNNNFDKSIFVYPNPTSSILNFNITENIELLSISISDISGKNVMQMPYSDSIQNKINLENLQAGVYFVKFTTKDNVSIVKKIVKE
ncbi:putative secreted protein (Por secretion system target) [Flavobacterium croceum DSM 17960]|uniref:Putative secreted protein (Por secretion system target) n=2 Tax=Flavobacterium TaxID=237 RepID=A0A2S4N9Y3_9FLAO|nr:putative secreted protein (Por secretion system target) [Flavobacterium croceum DSM 17960]